MRTTLYYYKTTRRIIFIFITSHERHKISATRLFVQQLVPININEMIKMPISIPHGESTKGPSTAGSASMSWRLMWWVFDLRWPQNELHTNQDDVSSNLSRQSENVSAYRDNMLTRLYQKDCFRTNPAKQSRNNRISMRGLRTE